MSITQNWYPKFFKNSLMGNGGNPLFEEDVSGSGIGFGILNCNIKLWYTEHSHNLENEILADLSQSELVSSQQIVISATLAEDLEYLGFLIPDTTWDSNEFNEIQGPEINFATISSVDGDFLFMSLLFNTPRSLNSSFELKLDPAVFPPRISFF